MTTANSKARASRPSTLRRMKEIRGMDRKELEEVWGDVFGTPMPAYSSRLVMRKLVYGIQEQTKGELPEALDSKVKAAARANPLASDTESTIEKQRPRRGKNDDVPIGSTLTKVWHGETISVTKTEDGYVYNDELFKSLSAVANHITGKKWNGRRFFNLNQRKGKNAK